MGGTGRMHLNNAEVPDSTGWLRRLSPHLGLVAAVFVALLVVTPTNDITLPDEGVYLAQAAALVEGGWWTERALPELKESVYTDAVIPELTRGAEMVPYSRHPLFPVLLSVGYLVSGPTGALVTSLLALLVAAVASGRLASHIDPRGEVPAFYLVALGSPLLFSGWQVAAHSPAAASAALGALSTVNYLLTRRRAWLVGIAVSAGACVMLRSEGLVLSATAALTLISSAGWHSARSRRLAPSLTAGLAVASGAAVAALCEMWWVRSIGRSGKAMSALDRVGAIDRSPGRAAWISLLRPWDGNATTANTWLILAVVALLGAAFAWRVASSRPLAASALLVLAGTSAVMSHIEPPALVNGLLPAFPVLGAGLLVARRDLLRKPVVAVLLATCASTAVVLCFVIYDDGGSTQWGGRFFHFLVPLLAPVVAIGGVRSLGLLDARQRRLVVSGIAVVAVSVGAMGVRTEIKFRSIHEKIRHAAEQSVPRDPSGLTSGAVLVVATRRNDGLSRTLWRKNPDFVAIRSASSSTFSLLRKLHAHGLNSAYVLTPVNIDLMEFGGRLDLQRLGWKRLETLAIPGMSVKILRYGPTEAAAGK